MAGPDPERGSPGPSRAQLARDDWPYTRIVGESPRTNEGPSPSWIDLLWIPLGAGGVGFVRMNGRLYEAVKALSERRPAKRLYHTALDVHVPEGRFTIENAWPSPDPDTASRGVVAEGPVFSHRLGRFRTFRYEVRRWDDGVIPDAADADGGPQLLSTDPKRAHVLLELVPSVPVMVWGRDDAGTGEMWNSNSVISWLLDRGDLAPDRMRPPAGGHAPGWDAGIRVARQGG
jgi:hypothetical protein